MCRDDYVIVGAGIGTGAFLSTVPGEMIPDIEYKFTENSKPTDGNILSRNVFLPSETFSSSDDRIFAKDCPEGTI